MIEFDASTEDTFKNFYSSLGEKDSRRFAGSLYQLSGGLSYICNLLGISHKTVHKGLAEVQSHGELTFTDTQRNEGGGRKRKWDDPALNAAFNRVIKPHTAGDPMDPDIKWTNLSRAEIIGLLKEEGFNVSKNTLKKIMEKNRFKKRKIQKRKSLKSVKDRDEQFSEINQARQEFTESGDPVISIDTKKKNQLGKT